MNLNFFEQQMNRLEPLGRPSEGAMDGYFDALKDIPADVFDAAITHALKTRAWFPKPAELRVDADKVAASVRPVVDEDVREVPLAQPFTISIPEAGTIVSVTREWKYYCDRCSDCGWASWWCGSTTVARPWYERSKCQRHGDHDPHEWVGRCACYETNPALVRRREALKKYADSPQKVA